ncbi:GNAT family N-acetyltransferase [Actinoplanes sp. NPDC023936]|uniref:GNAT family N-acetyltransferase n=1 Tax=Actinoplanes sp. NPDC023936 TaxID=3154910 RepID=UPI003400EEAA
MTIRPAVPDDADGLAEVHVRTWQSAYRGLIPQAYLDGLSVADRARQWREWLGRISPPRAVLVLEPGVSGFITVGAGDEDEAGHVYALYVLPERQGLGGGRALMAAGLAELVAAGFSVATLWVLDSNLAARRFYEAGGWHPDGATLVDESRGFPITEVRYRRAL